MFLCVLRLFLSDSNEEHVRTTDKHCMDGVQVSSVDCSCSVLAFLFLFPETGETDGNGRFKGYNEVLLGVHWCAMSSYAIVHLLQLGNT